MANIKTAISLQESLFKQVEGLARKMKISRSRLFAIALEDYLHRQQNRQLLDQINAAHQGEPDSSEKTRSKGMRRVQRRIVESEW